MTTKPKEVHHAQKSHTVVKPPPPPAPTKPVPPVDLTSAKVAIYRGLTPDFSKLTKEDKARLVADLDAESKAETIFRSPERETQRENARKLLR